MKRAPVIPFPIAERRVKLRQCPECGHLVPQMLIDRACFDMPCSKCGKAKLSDYDIYFIK